MGAEEKRKKTKSIPGSQSKARAGWPKHLRLVQATPSADFAVITAQLWSTITAIFSWVNNFAFNYYSWRGVGGRLKKSKKNTARAGLPRRLALVRATSRAEVDVIGAQLCSCSMAIFPWLALFWSARSHPLTIVDNSPNMHNTDFFPDCRLLSVSRWVHLDTVSRQIFGDIRETQFSCSKNGSRRSSEKCFPGGIGNRRIRFGYNLWFASHPLHDLYSRMTAKYSKC